MFTATALEKKILQKLKLPAMTKTQLLTLFSDEEKIAARNALEGCLVKGFVTQDADENITISEEGRKQI